MNKLRRKAISEIISDLQELGSTIDSRKDRITEIRDEEQETYDNMPQSFQDGEKGDAVETAVSEMDEVLCALDELDIETLVGHMETASE